MQFYCTEWGSNSKINAISLLWLGIELTVCLNFFALLENQTCG